MNPSTCGARRQAFWVRSGRVTTFPRQLLRVQQDRAFVANAALDALGVRPPETKGNGTFRFQPTVGRLPSHFLHTDGDALVLVGFSRSRFPSAGASERRVCNMMHDPEIQCV